MKNLGAIIISLISVFSLTSSFAAERATLLGITFDSNGITFQVPSGGCTDKNTLNVALLETSPVQVELQVIQRDNCEAYLPYGARIFYSYEELGLSRGTEFKVVNKVAPGVLRVE